MTQQVYAPPTTPTKRVGLAVTALVIGIVAFLLGLVPVIGIVFGLIGVVFGVIALTQNQPKGLAVTGLALAAVGSLVSLIVTVGAFAFMAPPAPAISSDGTVEQTGPVTPDLEKDSTPQIVTEFEGGVLVVGKNVEPGTYSTVETNGCYYSWMTSTGADAEIIKNDFVSSGPVTVTLEDEQVFSSNGCGTWVKE